ncbi:MAG: hypothetical protein M3R08_06060, partial [Bacteroidota bacterium]|nr:hypothetical protein [Bacteroidota bacterium]
MHLFIMNLLGALLISIPFFFADGSYHLSANEEIVNSATDTLPPLNQKVVEYVQLNMKQKVGRGECWDLAAAALEHAGAAWDGKYQFGTPVDVKSAEV